MGYNTWRLRQNGHHIVDDILNLFSSLVIYIYISEVLQHAHYIGTRLCISFCGGYLIFGEKNCIIGLRIFFTHTSRTLWQLFDCLSAANDVLLNDVVNTVKPVCNDHLYDKIYYLWLID